MAYIDLFCGPGKYEIDNLSAPLLIVQNTLNNPLLQNKMHFIFNDNDPDVYKRQPHDFQCVLDGVGPGRPAQLRKDFKVFCAGQVLSLIHI